ncbi:restriction endonuclease subunit S [uncultured Catenibacterium sp.]|uniref:restriction endonuclease subunit S n=1 Tax=uncultured Catenibacterium sp. TaxID=286142 RepID=UPI0025838BA8|nr:restriction endonuclease subunit S [uncultured Catenibacterium sp.]
MDDRMTAQKLRNSILQMAVQGKLVPQDPNDEPASVLLERIRKEKEQLIKEGKIKKNKKESYIFRGADNLHYEQIGKEVRCIEDELPFEIPDSWEWKSWGDISFKIQYGFNAPAKQSGTIKMVRISDIQNNAVNWDTVPYCAIDDSLINDYLLNDNDILFARTGGTVGKSFLVNNINEKAIYAGYLIRTVFDHKNLNPKYLKYFMESELYWNQLKNGTIATAQPNCNGQTLSKMKLPIPPLEEQNRIILKLQKLEPLIQKYQKIEEQLYELNSSIKEHLKKSILQYAIEGKLVPQDPNDEPASILLERIQKEKQKLISEGKIKKNKNESVIYRRDNSYYEKHDTNTISIDDRIPFSIPNSWEWISLGMVLEIERGGSPRPIKAYLTNDDNAINWIKIGDTEKDKKYINQVKEKIIPEGAAKSRMVYKGDFLLTNSMSFGRPYILNVDGCIHDGWLVLRDKYHAFNKDFLYYLLSSTFAYYQFCNSVSGAVVKNLNSEKVSASIFPIPPLNEQYKIATKLDKLYSYIE